MNRTMDIGQRLLGSMQADAPRPGAKAELRRALGLATVAGVAVATSTATAAAATASGVVSTSGKMGGAVAASGKVGALVGSSLLKTALTGTFVGLALGTAAMGTSVVVQRNSAASRALHSPVVAPHKTNPPTVVPAPIRDPERPENAPVDAKPSDESSLGAPSVVSDPIESRLSASLANRAPLQAARSALSNSESIRQPSERSPLELAANSTGNRSSPAELGQVPATTASALPRETAQLALVRAALREGDTARGLAGLERYEREFSGGILHPEAEILRIEALVLSGNVVAARQGAQQFIASHPSSPHVARIRKLVGL